MAQSIKNQTEVSTQQFIDFIKNSICYIDIEDSCSPFYIFNEVENRTISLTASKTTLESMVKNDNDAIKTLFDKNPCKIKCIPYTKGKITFPKNELVPVVNLYNHPHSTFNKPNQAATLNKKYKDFFEHLFPNPLTKEYVYDWISNSLHRKNLTFLIVIGEKGIGKGLLYEILSRLHLKENSMKIDNDTFESRFNGELKGKTLVFADEISIKDDKQMSKLKMYVNEEMAIEDKGKKKETIATPFNLIIASNNYDAIRLDEKNRRFSIVETTKTSMIDNPFYAPLSLDEYYRSLENNEADIEELYWFFYNRKVINQMNVPYVDANQQKELIESSMTTWEEVGYNFIRERKGRVDFRDIKSKLEMNVKIPPGCRKFYNTFKERYSESIRSCKHGNSFNFEYIGDTI